MSRPYVCEPGRQLFIAPIQLFIGLLDEFTVNFRARIAVYSIFHGRKKVLLAFKGGVFAGERREKRRHRYPRIHLHNAKH